LQAEEKHESANASTSGRPFYTDECTAFVRGLPQSIEDGELKAVFADCGDLKEIRITRDPQTGRPKVYVFSGFAVLLTRQNPDCPHGLLELVSQGVSVVFLLQSARL